MVPARRLACAMALVLAGCGSDVVDPAPPPPSTPCEDPLAVALPDGSCFRPGVPEAGCATGFVHDDAYGCEAILPAERCPPGTMAVPGDESCREVMACGQGAWGDIPVDATTQYVDASYAGGGSDGSAAAPWTTVSEAITAASSGALVAIAAGTYSENLVIMNKAVRLWGVCPERVTVVASSQALNPCPAAAVCVLGAETDGSEIVGVSLSGAGLGVIASGSRVLIDRVRAHDLSDRGVDVEDAYGPSALELRDSLVEGAHDAGAYAMGSTLSVTRSVLRSTLARVGGTTHGRGVVAQVGCDAGPLTGQSCPESRRADVTLQGSLVEDNNDTGVFVAGGQLLLDASVVRGTTSGSVGDGFGRGVVLQLPCDDPSGTPICELGAFTTGVLSGAVVDSNLDVGLFLGSAQVTVERSVVRATQPRAIDGADGHGVSLDSVCVAQASGTSCQPSARAALTMSESLVELSHEFGVVAIDADLTLDAAVVRNTATASSVTRGTGLHVQSSCSFLAAGSPCDPSRRSKANVQHSLVDQSFGFGVLVLDSEASIAASAVRATSPYPDTSFFGDGITVVSEALAASTTVDNAIVDNSARAALATFGASLSVGSTHLTCAEFSIATDAHAGFDQAVHDLGGNLCGCPLASEDCRATSAGLAPPEPPP